MKTQVDIYAYYIRFDLRYCNCNPPYWNFTLLIYKFTTCFLFYYCILWVKINKSRSFKWIKNRHDHVISMYSLGDSYTCMYILMYSMVCASWIIYCCAPVILFSPLRQWIIWQYAPGKIVSFLVYVSR